MTDKELRELGVEDAYVRKDILQALEKENAGGSELQKAYDDAMAELEAVKKQGAVEKAILEAGGNALRPGGVLVYSTCTLNPAENEAVTDRFLSLHPEFKRTGKSETIFPQGGENDGFFCDRLEKQ